MTRKDAMSKVSTNSVTSRTIEKLCVLFALAVTLVAPATAAAELVVPDPTGPSYPFNPSLEVKSGTYVAGEHPTLSIHVQRGKSYCLDPGEIQTCPQNAETPGQDNANEEQEFKKLVFTLPKGMAADPNAVPQCEVVAIEWSPPGSGLEPFTNYFCGPPDNPAACEPVVEVPPFFEAGAPGTFKLAYCKDYPPVGVVRALGSVCYAYEDPSNQWCFADQDPKKGIGLGGPIFLAVPHAGEQARLVPVVGGPTALHPHPDKLLATNDVAIPASVTVSKDGLITATADDIPGLVDVGSGFVAAPAHDLTFTLYGSTGAQGGHALLTNPTSCSPRALVAEAQGYAFNTYRDSNGVFQYAFGEGKTLSGLTANYPVGGCNSIPYVPTFDLKVDPPTPGAAPAVSSTITQALGEATTGAVKVRFPKGFQVNFDNKNAQCSDDQFAAGSCPEGSVVGTASADSRLLPVGSGPLNGTAYLGETGSEDIKLLLHLANDFLPGGIDLAGHTTLAADGSPIAVFDGVPELPISSFTLNLLGGKDKSLLLNPKTCGEKSVDATFTSHQGKVHKVSSPVKIDCTAPTLNVALDSKRLGSHPNVNLSVTGSGLKSVAFTLPKQLRVRTGRGLGLGTSYGSFGYVIPGTPTVDGKLFLFRETRSGAKEFSAVSGGSPFTTADLSGGRTIRKRGRKSKVVRRASTIRLGTVPEGTTSASLELFGRRDKLLTNPSTCGGKKRRRLSLTFRANVTAVDGQAHALSETVDLKCRTKRTKKARS